MILQYPFSPVRSNADVRKLYHTCDRSPTDAHEWNSLIGSSVFFFLISRQ